MTFGIPDVVLGSLAALLLVLFWVVFLLVEVSPPPESVLRWRKRVRVSKRS